MFWLILVVSLLLAPTFIAALFSIIWKLTCIIFKLMFTFWQITIVVVLIGLLLS